MLARLQLLLFAILTLGVLGFPPSEAAEPDKDTLRLLFWQAPTTLNPHFASGVKDQAASRISYEPLASFDREGHLVPFLAAEIPSLENGGVAPDGRSVTWKLKSDIKWSDGQPFSARDVVFTYKYITNPEVKSTSSDTYKSIESVEALDDLTVKVTFRSSTPSWAEPFTGVRGMILPEHVFADFNNGSAETAPVNLEPVGTGPYIAKEFRTEDVLLIGEDVVNTVKIIYEANPHYRNASALPFKYVTLQGGGDAEVAAKAVLRDNAVDFAWNLQVDDNALIEMETGGTGKVVLLFGAYVERLMLNFSDPNQETVEGERSSTRFPHPFLTDPQLRKALALAIDREQIAALYGRTGQAASNILVAPEIYKSPNTSFEFDLKKAAALLDAAGWIDHNNDGIRDKDGMDLSVVYQTSINPVRQRTQEIIGEALESLGIQVEKKMIEGSIFLGSSNDNTNTRRHFYADLEEYAYGNKSPDPSAYLRGWTCSDAAQMANGWSGSNYSRYCNPAYDALYTQSMTEIDPEKRRELFIKMNDLLIADAAVIPLVHWADTSGIANNLRGYDATPWDSETWNIAEWRREE